MGDLMREIKEIEELDIKEMGESDAIVTVDGSLITIFCC